MLSATRSRWGQRLGQKKAAHKNVKLLGQCAGCPSADLTNETVVEAELKAALPDLVEKAVVVQTVSDKLWEQAKKLLREHHL